MIIYNFIDFINVTKKKELLALDVSKKRIGIALSNIKIKVALPLITLNRSKFIVDIQKIIELYLKHNCGGIVIGYPINLNSDKNRGCQSIRAFSRLLLEYKNIPIYLENEEYSTYAVKEFFKNNKLPIKKPLDHHAASYFLQAFLNRLSTIPL